MDSHSLKQGKYLKSKYIESFTDNTDNTNTIINEINDLENKMTDILNKLHNEESIINHITKEYIQSTDAINNIYLNKNIHFSNGQYGYVTNKAVLKMYPSKYIYDTNNGKHGCPKDFIEADFNLPDNLKIGLPVTTGTGIKLMVGSPLQQEESCGNEGKNVYVDKLITNTTATYKGCYNDNPNLSTMTYIGASPPKNVNIVNGNFDQPNISKNTYKYISDSSTVFGWTFDAVLINNSKDWNYVQPYPNGSQAVSLQNLCSMFQTIKLNSGNYTLNWYSIGRPSGANLINIYCLPSNTPINIQSSSTIFTYTPTINNWIKYSTPITIDTTGTYNIGFYGTISTGDVSSAIQNITIISGSTLAEGTYTFDTCKQEAINNGYLYFALQDVNTTNNTGYCGVSYNNVLPTRYGESNIPVDIIALWSSNTSGTGNYAILTSSGSLSVFSSNSSAPPSNYLGCYGDSSHRALALQNGGKQSYNIESCQNLAQNSKYYGLQNSTSGQNAQCGLSDDEISPFKYGKAGNCTQLSDGTWSGGGWSNAVYRNTPDSHYFLVLQDDGNMCIYRGSSPTDNQGTIWCTMTNGKQQESNPNNNALNSKYKTNYLTSDNNQKLESGDFIGSTNGTTFLIMQSDGNLVLYTTVLGPNCSLNNDSYGGGVGANALYKLDEVAFPSNMGKIGYIDAGSNVLEYPSNMIIQTYESKENMLSSGVNFLPGYTWTTGTIDDAKTACNKEPNCTQFITTTQLPGQYTLTTGSNSNLNNMTDYTTYIKTNANATINNDQSCDKMMTPIDTIQWEHYSKGSSMNSNTTCGITKLITTPYNNIENLKIQLEDVSNNLINKINILEKQNINNNKQINTQEIQINKNNKKYKENAKKILTYIKQMPKYTKSDTLEGYENHYIDNIVSDSNIISTQSIYSYIVWTIIAIIMLLITIFLFIKK